MNSQTKYPFSLKILSERLNKEKKDLVLWNEILENRDKSWDDFNIRQAIGNISSTENRIKDLEGAILLISTSS